MALILIICCCRAGWSNSGAPDLTVLDPAIVSSGQLTDSRSDSPPHWMKTMEQLTEAGPHPLWNNLIPYNLPSSGLPTGLGPHTGQSGPAAPTQRSVAPMWPPTSPPPGFNSISPLHHPKQHEPHKIESKCWVKSSKVIFNREFDMELTVDSCHIDL